MSLRRASAPTWKVVAVPLAVEGEVREVGAERDAEVAPVVPGGAPGRGSGRGRQVDPLVDLDRAEDEVRADAEREHSLAAKESVGWM